MQPNNATHPPFLNVLRKLMNELSFVANDEVIHTHFCPAGSKGATTRNNGILEINVAATL